MARRNNNTDADPLHGGRVHVARSRGAVSGILLVVLGAWGAVIPFVAPPFNFGYTPNTSWHWTAGRGWLEVLPGVVVVIGALMLLLSANRITASFGGWLAVIGGAWFVFGRDFIDLFHLGTPGDPRGSSTGLRLIETLTFFDGLGVLIIFFAASALGRLSVRSVRDVRTAQRREVEAESERRRQDAYAEQRRQQLGTGDSADERSRSASDGDHTESTSGSGPNGSSDRAPDAVSDPTPTATPPNGATASNRRTR